MNGGCFKSIHVSNKSNVIELNAKKYSAPCIVDGGAVFNKGLKLGFCDDGSRASNHFLKLGYHEKELIETGLFYLHEQKNILIPSFKNRIIFPIKNLFGEFIGCVGRTVLPSVPAKYINSPETIFFKN